ncbi:MAG: hypothetical protein ACLR23_11590 [Clostridia bacterium]
MTFAQNMLLYPDGDRGKLQRQLRRRKAVNLYCICACPNHPYPLEIFEAKRAVQGAETGEKSIMW